MATRRVTSFPVITPVADDYIILSDVSNSGLFSKSTPANTKTALGINTSTVVDYAGLSGIAAPVALASVIVSMRATAGDGGGGVFIWDAGDNSTSVANDPLFGVYVPPTSDTTGASGVWVRQHNGGVDIRWFGATGGGVADDTNKIQKAIDYCYAILSGGIVLIPIGVYIFTTISVKTGVSLRGAGGTLKLKDNHCVDAGVSYYLIHNLTFERCSFENLVIDGNKANNSLFLVADAITAVGSNTTVRGCNITNPPDSGIMFSDVSLGSCFGNTIVGARDCGIYINAAEGSTTGNIEVADNIIDDCVFTGIACKRSSKDVIISNNVISSCGSGITVEDFGVGTGGTPSHLIISNNLLNDIGYPHRATPGVAERGISLDNCANVLCEGNKGKNVSGTGVFLYGSSQVVVTGNHFTGYITSPLTNLNYGLYSLIKAAAIPTDNIITNNIFILFQDYACRLSDSAKSTIANNKFDAVEVAFRMDAGCDNNIISFNQFTSTTAPWLTAGALGNILLYNTTNTGVTEWENAGFLRSTAEATPIGVITPLFVGQMLWITTAGPKIYMAYGLVNTEWVQIA